MWTFHDGMSGWAFFGNLWNVLSWVVLIGLIVWIVNRLSHRGHDEPRGSEKQDAFEIAKLRYAKGEITQEEFDEIKRNLAAP